MSKKLYCFGSYFISYQLAFGNTALVNAYKVEKFWYLGNKAEAEKRSKKAKMWSIIALGSMVLSGVLGAIAGIISALRDGVIEFF